MARLNYAKKFVVSAENSKSSRQKPGAARHSECPTTVSSVLSYAFRIQNVPFWFELSHFRWNSRLRHARLQQSNQFYPSRGQSSFCLPTPYPSGRPGAAKATQHPTSFSLATQEFAPPFSVVRDSNGIPAFRPQARRPSFARWPVSDRALQSIRIEPFSFWIDLRTRDTRWLAKFRIGC